MKNKRGDYKWDVMIALILGLMVLSLSIYFIFQEFFNEEMIDQESCRQSVILRATLPEVEKFGVTWASFKDDFQLKCKTQVYSITKEDIDKKRAGKIIADAMVQCWYLFGNGDYKIFPSDVALDSDSFCVPCARISLTEEAKKHLIDRSEITIDIQDSLENGIYQGVPYKAYLNGVGSMPAILFPMDMGSDSFRIGEDVSISGIISNNLWEFYRLTTLAGFVIDIFKKVNVETIYEPKTFDPLKGDLLIVYGSTTFTFNNMGKVIFKDAREDTDKDTSKDSEDNGNAYLPYLFYFQIDQENPDSFEEIRDKKFLTGSHQYSLGICENWEGIPA